MGSFAAYQKLKPESLKRITKESVKGIQKWFKSHPKKKVCLAAMWYGIELDVKREIVSEQINSLLKATLKSDAEDTQKWAKRPKGY